TTVPTRKSEIFSTAADAQTSVEVHVLQGERPMAAGNKKIGRFHLDGLPPAPRGVPKIEVAFDIDANGILHVSAKDQATGKEQSIRIEASSGITESDIQRMVKDADEHSAEDRRRKETAESRNRADARLYEVRKGLKEYGDKVDAALKGRIEESANRLEEALKGEDVAPIDSAREELEKLWSEAAAAMYQSAGQGGAGGPEGAPNAGEGQQQQQPGAAPGKGAVDAEYTVEN